jgi:hypothetical protein
MNDAFGMSNVQPLRDLNGQFQKLIGLDWRAFRPAIQRFTFYQFHGNERLALMLTNIKNGTDIRMTQGRSGTGLPLQAPQGMAIPGHIFREKLECHAATEPNVLGFVDYAHTATTELLSYTIMRDRLANQAT